MKIVLYLPSCCSKPVWLFLQNTRCLEECWLPNSFTSHWLKFVKNIHQMYLFTVKVCIHILLWCAFLPLNTFNHSNAFFFVCGKMEKGLAADLHLHSQTLALWLVTSLSLFFFFHLLILNLSTFYNSSQVVKTCKNKLNYNVTCLTSENALRKPLNEKLCALHSYSAVL